MKLSARQSPRLVTALAVPAAALTGAVFVVIPGLLALGLPTAIALGGSIILSRTLVPKTDEELSNRVSRWALGSFVIHLALGLVITSSFQLTTLLGGDAIQYHNWAGGIVAHWESGVALPPDLPAGKTGFPYLLGAMYWLFGPFPSTGLAINAFFASALVPLTVDTTRRLYGRAAARWVPALVVLPVGFLLWPGQLLREAGILFFMAVVLNAAVRLQQGTAKLSLILTMTVGLGLLATFRSYMALTMAGGVIVGISLGRRGLSGLKLGGGAAVLTVGLIAGLGLGYSGIQAIQNTDLATVNNIRQDSANGASSGFLTEADVSTGSRALTYLPFALPRFLLGPFPWEIGGGRQLLVLPDVLVWWALLPSARRGYRRARATGGRGLFIILFPVGAVSLVLSLLIANYGTVVRSRMQVLLLLVPLIALGLAHRRVGTAEESGDADARSGPVLSTA